MKKNKMKQIKCLICGQTKKDRHQFRAHIYQHSKEEKENFVHPNSFLPQDIPTKIENEKTVEKEVRLCSKYIYSCGL